MLKAGMLSHLVKEIKQNNGNEQPKVTKKGETSKKDKALAILMVQPWEIVARQRITQSFSPNLEISFPPLQENEEMEGPMIIEAEIGSHCIHQHSALAWMNFMVVRSQSSYNEIIGRPGVRKLQAVPSTEKPSATKPIVEERVKVAINLEYPEQTVIIGSTLTEGGHNKLCGLLQRNLDIFAWKPADMTGVPRHIAKHCLNVREGCSLIRQKKRGQPVDRNPPIQEEVGKLVEAGIMREVHYHDLLSNPVMVKNMMEAGGYEIVKDIEETFKTLREINMKLNPKKCPFGVEEGMFLGYKVNAKGLKVCPDKKLIAELPMLKAPIEKEELIVYLAAANETVSAVLMTEREAKQMPIYFVSRALRGLELNYTSMEKLVLALVHASKRLKRYFQAHPIIVITDQPIHQILLRPKVAGRLQKWSIELGEYAIHYRSRVSVKGQILADFIVERLEEDSSDTLMEEEGELLEPWILFTDGSSCTDGSGAGLILTNLEGMEFTYALRFRFDATNNEAEYEV
nr:reverse transcriptase domain-containing protein [Tanacetum cinerariifolium]